LNREIAMKLFERLFVYSLVLCGLLWSTSCEEVPEKPLDQIPEIPVPYDLSALTGSDSITVSWSYDTSFNYSGFLIERSEDLEVTWTELATVSGPPYPDRSLRAGVVYWYRIAGIDQAGIRSVRSLSTPARAAVFALHINDGAALTNSRDVVLTWTAPATTQNARFSEDPTFSDTQWRDFTSFFNFTLSTGDGNKTVYAQFLDDGGHLTHIVNSSITLDTFSEINALTLSPDTISPGGSVHFSVTPSNNELDGYALIFIEGMGNDPLTARDEGVGGDVTAGDGVYELDFTFAQFFRQASMRCSSVFTDAAGNPSAEKEFDDTLIMTDPPAAVTLQPPALVGADVEVRWTRSLDDHFASYNTYRDTSSPVDPETAVLADKVTQQDVVTFLDTGLVSGLYYYRVFIVNDLDEGEGSNELSISVP
jgi:hypothetical protein